MRLLLFILCFSSSVFAEPFFVSCESWQTDPDLVCSDGSEVVYTVDEMQQLIGNDFTPEPMSASDFNIVLGSSIIVLFAAWCGKRLLALFNVGGS